MTDAEHKSQDKKNVVVVDEDLRDLIPGYLENRQKDVEEILAALDRNDFETIRSVCHKMKGSGGGYGFDRISEIGKDCEDAAKRSQAQEVRDQVNCLKVYLDKVEVIFQP